MGDAATDANGFDLADAGAYAYWNAHVLRFADLDALGHINNLAFGQVFEAGRVAFWEAAGIPVADPELTTMLVRMTMDYRAQMSFPGDVTVGTRALRLGRTSCVLGQGLFHDGACTATSEAVCVLVDRQSDRPMPIPEALRARILALSDG